METQERNAPVPDDGEVLIRLHTAGLCGSDEHAYLYDGYQWIPNPRIMGHEYFGEVIEVGADVMDLEKSDKVVEELIHDCGHCFQCKNGQSNVPQDFSITGMHRDDACEKYTTVAPRYVHAIPSSCPWPTPRSPNRLASRPERCSTSGLPHRVTTSMSRARVR